jgi:hypothetical protein
MDTEFDLLAPQVNTLMNAVFRSLSSSAAPPARSACTPPISLPNHPTCTEGALALAGAPARPILGHFTTEGAGAKDLAADNADRGSKRLFVLLPNVKRETTNGS